MKGTTSSASLIKDIASVSCFAGQLLEKGKDYETLLRYILNLRIFEEDNSCPEIRTITKDLNMSHARLRKQLEEIYQDLMGNEEYKIKKEYQLQEIVFWVRSINGSLSWTVNSLPFVPRVGEQVELNNFRAYYQHPQFYVQSVIHEFLGDKQVITIILVPGKYNLYWHLRRDESELKEELHWSDYMDLSERDLKKKIIPRTYRNTYNYQ